MDLTPMHKRVIALDVHQAKITACLVVEHEGCRAEAIKRDFDAFKRDRRALAQSSLEIRPEVVVMEIAGVSWKSPFCGAGGGGHHLAAGQCAACQGRVRSQDRHGRRAVAGHAGAGRAAAGVIYPAGGLPPASPGCASATKARGHVQRREETGCTRCWWTPGYASTWWSATSTARARGP